jgi:hypothetical protein
VQDLSSYRERNEILCGIGFTSYRKYLDSDLWAEIRAAVLNRDEHRCHGCGKLANQVHHTRYTAAVLLGHDITSLRSLCGKCHRIAEFHRSGGKVSQGYANKRLKTIRRRNSKNNAWNSNPEYRRLYREKKRLLSLPRAEVREQLSSVRKQLRAIVKATGVIASTPTYAPGDASSVRGAIHESAPDAVNVPSGRRKPIPA